MKKGSLVFCMVLVCIFAFCACSGIAEMQIGKAQLTEEETSMLGLVGFDTSNSQMFDYNVNKDIKSIIITINTLNDRGKWDVTGEMTVRLDNPKGRLAIGKKLTEEVNGTSIYVSSKKNNNNENVSNYVSTLSSIFTEKDTVSVSVVWNEEINNVSMNLPIPLMIFYADRNGNITTVGTENFFSPGKITKYDMVEAITVRFL